MTAQLSPFFLSFSEAETRRAYEREKIIYYSKLMPVMLLVILQLTFGLEAGKQVMGSSQHTTTTTAVNGSMVIAFLLITIVVRYKHTASWFVAPLSIFLVSYYLYAVDENAIAGVTTEFTIIVGMGASFFILCVFNEVWLISVASFAPCCAYAVWKQGQDMKGSEDNMEMFLRTAWVILCFGIVGYNLEKQSKLAFQGQQAGDKTLYNWLKIFETFPEGLALIRDGKILYANRAVARMFELNGYDREADPFND